MTDPNTAALLVVVDRSGSMQLIRADAEGGLNGLLEDQRKQPGKLLVSIVQFDGEVETVCRLTPVADVPPYRLAPRGSTALLDAVGRGMTEMGEALAALPEDERPGKVMVLIITDGEENASHEWTLDKVKDAIAHQRDVYGWEFQFHGADTAAWAGRSLGIQHVVSYSPTAQGTAGTYSAASHSVTMTRSGLGGFGDPNQGGTA